MCIKWNYARTYEYRSQGGSILKLATLSVLGLLVAGLLGTILGINRTLKTKGSESNVLQSLSTVLGILLISFAVYTVFTSGASASNRHLLPFMTILGLALSARWLESIPVSIVFTLVVGLVILYVLSHGGIPHSLEEVLQKQNVRKFLLIIALVIVATVLLMISTVEKLVDVFLNILGQGPVVITLSVISLIHAALILSGHSRGLMKYL